MAAGSVFAPVVIPLRQVHFESRSSKNIIDEKTPIELVSDTKNAVVYYTITGEKPEPFQKLGRKSTFKYSKPFTLSAGKRTVKAIAVNANDQTSSVVTKVFQVQPCEVEKSPSLSQLSETVSLGDDNLSLSSVSDMLLDEDNAPPYSSTQVLQSTSKPDYKICLQCKHPLPNIKDARFCPKCGYTHPVLADTREAVTPTNFAYCKQCHAVVPKKVLFCPSCHSPMGTLGDLPTIVAQKDLVVESGVTYDYCGTANTPDSHMCVTCERNITPLQNFPPNKRSYPLIAFGSEEYHIMCSACGRVNARDARYCDWCGSQPKKSVMDLTCKVCSVKNDWQSLFCVSCKAHLEPAVRPSLVDRQNKLKATGDGDGVVWYPVIEGDVEPEEVPVIPTFNKSTQTEGIFYKSAQTLQQTVNQMSLKQQEIEETRFGSKKVSLPLLEFSPGRGYWRQQVDHIAHHLKVHSSNCSQFRESIGNHQIGKLVSTEVAEEDGELKLSLLFETKKNTTSNTRVSQSIGSTIGVVRQSTSVDSSMLGGSSRLAGIAQLAASVNKTKKLLRTNPTKQTVENYLLLEEVSSNGKGRADIVTQLIEQGGSVNAVSDSGTPVLCLAARHGRCDVLNVLLSYGAQIDISAKNGNTALHEAVLNGYRDCVELLLRSGCSVKLTNKLGQTVAEIAQSKDNKEIIKLIASHVGSTALKSLLK